MSQNRHGLRDIGHRYRLALSVSWRRRKEMDTVSRTSQELAFQPAVIELVDTPVSPTPRRSMQAIILLFLIAMVWACIGKLDVVAVAQGKVVSGTRTKIVQALEAAVVTRITVADGQQVRRGDLLLELDAVGVRSDIARAEAGLANARLQAMRNAALAAAYERGSPPTIGLVEGTSKAQLVEA